MRKKIVAGNWKMNTLPAEGVELAKAVAARRHETDSSVELIVCPPFTHLSEVVKATRGKGVAVGAQNCAAEEKGAYTGEVSAAMLAALGVEYVILGHSERREYYGETSATLNRKLAMHTPTTSFRYTAWAKSSKNAKRAGTSTSSGHSSGRWSIT